jgi:heptosyltransferase III
VLGAEFSLPSIVGGRILAIRAGALGDTILALPSVGALRRLAGPDGEVDFVGREPAVRLAHSPRLATRVHSIDRTPFRALFDASLDDAQLTSFLRPFALVAAWANLPLLEEKLSKLAIPLLHASPHPPPGVHVSDHLYQSLSPLGLQGSAPAPEVDLEPETRRVAFEFLERSGIRPSDFIALHPSSGSPRKNWPKERFLGLASRIREQGWPFVWIEGEADREVVAFLARCLPAPVARELPLPVLAAILAMSRGFVGNDSGVSHLAAAVSARTIAVFGPTDPTVWAPRGPCVHVAFFGSDVESVWGNARSLFGTC